MLNLNMGMYFLPTYLEYRDRPLLTSLAPLLNNYFRGAIKTNNTWFFSDRLGIRYFKVYQKYEGPKKIWVQNILGQKFLSTFFLVVLIFG